MVNEEVKISLPLGYISWIMNNPSPSRLNPEENSLQSCLHQLSFPSSLQSSWKYSQSESSDYEEIFRRCPFYFISVQSEDRELDIAAALNTAGASADSQHGLPILILNVQPVNKWSCCNSNASGHQSYYLLRLHSAANVPAVLTITEKAPTSAFTFRTLLRHWLTWIL